MDDFFLDLKTDQRKRERGRMEGQEERWPIGRRDCDRKENGSFSHEHHHQGDHDDMTLQTSTDDQNQSRKKKYLN